MHFPWWECIYEDGSMSCHWYMMKMDRCGSIGIWCIVGKMYRWFIIVLSWLIRCTNRWTPKWSPYGEIPHGKTLYGLSYPRRKVEGPPHEGLKPPNWKKSKWPKRRNDKIRWQNQEGIFMENG